MKNYRFKFPRAVVHLIVFCIFLSLFATGCRLINGYDDDKLPAATSVALSGQIQMSTDPASFRKAQASTQLKADQPGVVAVADAEVWIEELADNPKFHTKTNASGVYVINDIPPGQYRVVARLQGGVIAALMKNRSDKIEVGKTPGVVNAPDLQLFAAKNFVTGQLRGNDGEFLPENTVLTLWGEPFKVEKNGFFTSPALPANYNIAEIQVQLPGGNGKTSFSAPFVSDIVPAFVELKVAENSETENNAPSAVLLAELNGELVSKVNPGAIVKLTATGYDRDQSDNDRLTAIWQTTHGKLANGSSQFEKFWTAPDHFSLATITVEIKDPNGAAGSANLPILVGIDTPTQQDTKQPEVALSCDVTETSDSTAFLVQISFDEPVTDFSIEDITVVNGTASELTEKTAQKSFTVIIDPTDAGEVEITIAENAVQDLSGNANNAGNTLTVTNIISPVLSSEKAIVAFSLSGLDVIGTIKESEKTIELTVPFTTDVTALVANFTVSASATVKVGENAQISGSTANDFTSPVSYQVIAEDSSSVEYLVTVNRSEPLQINAAAVDIVAPVLGATPQNADAVEAATAHADYTVSSLSWNEALTDAGKFKAGQTYTATVTLTSKNYKKFQAAAFTPTVAGALSVGTTTTSGTDIGNTVTFTATYAPTGALAVSGIEVTTQPTRMSYAEESDGILSLAGMMITETYNDGTTGTVAFADGTAAGYTASPANGASLTNAEHNGTSVTLTHTASGKTAATANLAVSAIVEISAAAVDIVAPVLGATPQNADAVEAATAHADYTVSALNWNEALADAGKFKAGQTYTATVTLTSKNYKKFQAAAFTPTVAGALSVGTTTTSGTDIGNTVTFTVTYAPTGALELTSIALTTQPDRMAYTAIANILSLSGMVVTETFNDGSTNKAIFSDGSAAGYTTSISNGTTLDNSHNGATITVTHTASGKTALTESLTILSDYNSANIGTLRAIPAGTFQRDATAGNTSYVSAFRMSRTEITRAQFLAIMGADPSVTSFSSTPSHPVQNVNWYHVLAFCNKLSIAEGLTPVYEVTGVDFSTLTFANIPTAADTNWDNVSCDWNADGYRLPTEMEWMWAAMGAQHDRELGALSSGINISGYSKAFAGSNGSNLNFDYAWFADNTPGVAQAVGSRSENELGLHDMSGNVMEWCWSRAGDYPVGAVSDYSGATTGSYRILRGGRFNNTYLYITVAYRFSGYYANYTQDGVNGFRVVRR
ncbi:MAG: hypothetical protein GQF41_3848 [Candidatus Rifleibacterium amylolyticum]|nr:MAG: hypothetical protein GQF41_3848 [Candidatus Rifleibacterium amylolyticum]